MDYIRKLCWRKPDGPIKEVKERLPLKQKFSHGVGHILNDLAANVWFSYLIIYLTKVAGLPNRHTGLVVFLGQIADAVFTPFVGIMCDRTVCRYGRRKIWHLIGCVLTSFSFPLLFIRLFPSDASNSLKVCYFVAIAAVFQFGWGCVQISHLSLIPEISERSSERIELNAIRSALTFICGIYVYGVTWILLRESKAQSLTPSAWKQFLYLSFIIVGTGNVFNIIFHVLTKEPPSEALLKWKERQRQKKLQARNYDGKKASSKVVYQQTPLNSPNRRSGASPSVFVALCDNCDSKSSKSGTSGGVTDSTDSNASYSEKVPLVRGAEEGLEIIDRSKEPRLQAMPGKTKLQWLKDPALYKVGLMYTCTRLVVNISQSYLPLYLTDTMKFEKEAIAYFPLVVLVSGVLASIGVKPMNKRLGSKMTFSIGTLMAISACFWFYVQSIDGRKAIYATTILMGCGVSVMLVTSLSLIANLIGNDKKSAAFVYGAVSFTDKLSSGAVIAIIQELNPRKRPENLCPTCDAYVRNIQSLAPGIAALVALVVGILFFEPMFICKRRVQKHDVGVQAGFNDDEEPSENESSDSSDVEKEKKKQYKKPPSNNSNRQELELQQSTAKPLHRQHSHLSTEDTSGYNSCEARNLCVSFPRDVDNEYTALRLASPCLPSPVLDRRTIV